MSNLLGVTHLTAHSIEWFGLLALTSLKGFLILALAAGLNAALSRASAATRHSIWRLALVCLGVLPVLSFGLPGLQVRLFAGGLQGNPDQSAVSASAIEPAQLQASTVGSGISAPPDRSQELVGAPSLKNAEVAPAAATAVPDAIGFRWAAWAAGWAIVAWLAGVLLVLARLILGMLRMSRICVRADVIADPAWHELERRVASRVGLSRRVVLLKSNRVTMPLTFDWFRAAVVLPSSADQWSTDRRHVVLLHELAHVQRRDCLTQAMAQITCALYWFNPLVWLAATRLHIERERACDDQVLGSGTRASDYADHLLDIARSLRSASCSTLAAVAMAHHTQLEGRLLAILDPKLNRRLLSRRARLTVGLSLAAAALLLAALQPSSRAESRQGERKESAGRATRASVVENKRRETKGLSADVVAAREAPGTPEGAGAEMLQESRLLDAARSGPEPTPIKEAAGLTLAPAQDQQPDHAQTGSPRGVLDQKDKDALVESLLGALKDEDEQVREQALFALAQIGGPRALEALTLALKDGSARVRERAVHALGISHVDALDPLSLALKDASPRVREQAAWALGVKGDHRAAPALASALRDENSGVREKAAWALGVAGDKTAVEPLVAALKDADARVRSTAAWALGVKGDQRAIKPLSDAMKDSDKEVRKKAVWALGVLLTQGYSADGVSFGSRGANGSGKGVAFGRGSDSRDSESEEEDESRPVKPRAIERPAPKPSPRPVPVAKPSADLAPPM